MFNLFRRMTARGRSEPSRNGLVARFTRATSLAVALSDEAAKHMLGVSAGHVEFPIHKSKTSSVLQIWHHLRLEAFHRAIRFGKGSILDLADIGKQTIVLSTFLDNKCHLQFPQPFGSEADQSVQGMFQAYVYLGEVGTEVGDRATDRFMLSSESRDITTDLTLSARTLQGTWSEYLSPHGTNSAELPQTFFDLFLGDLNEKSKSIALSLYFGPDKLRMAEEHIENIRLKHGEHEANEFRTALDSIVASQDPDEAIARRRY